MKPLNLPHDVAKAFLADMLAYFAEEDGIKRDALAAKQAWLLNQHRRPRERMLRTDDVKQMFVEMRNHLSGE
jgi:hypothetical protein